MIDDRKEMIGDQLSDKEILSLLEGCGIITGDNQYHPMEDDYLYRSLGHPTNVAGKDLIKFARTVIDEYLAVRRIWDR